MNGGPVNLALFGVLAMVETIFAHVIFPEAWTTKQVLGFALVLGVSNATAAWLGGLR